MVQISSEKEIDLSSQRRPIFLKGDLESDLEKAQ